MNIWNHYLDAFRGLSRASWLLALIMLINRAGSMVVVFMAVYLRAEKGFDLEQIGVLLGGAGVGAILGSYMGGKLTDKIGHARVQIGSLLGGGLILILLQFVDGFYPFLIMLFLNSLIADMLRPANAAAIAAYAKPENITRAFTLNRMAMNLGFSIGPALGGLLADISYSFLFWIDGISCVMAAGLLLFWISKRPQQHGVSADKKVVKAQSPYTDIPYLWFILTTFLFALVFFQFFTAFPLYYKEVYHLSPSSIGLLLAWNGALVFLIEMPFVHAVSNKSMIRKIIAAGLLVNGIGFALLNVASGIWVLVLSMTIVSFAEILAMPFMATLVTQRSTPENRGAYMGLYTIAYASAHIAAPILGTQCIAALGYEGLWWVLLGISLLTVLIYKTRMKLVAA